MSGCYCPGIIKKKPHSIKNVILTKENLLMCHREDRVTPYPVKLSKTNHS